MTEQSDVDASGLMSGSDGDGLDFETKTEQQREREQGQPLENDTTDAAGTEDVDELDWAQMWQTCGLQLGYTCSRTQAGLVVMAAEQTPSTSGIGSTPEALLDRAVERGYLQQPSSWEYELTPEVIDDAR
jgi:hypothetical protein